MPAAPATLKRRSEFLRIRGGARWSTPLFVLETKPAAGRTTTAGPRFGYTVTKALGTAVVRNRIRRRLKAAVAELAAGHARPGHDYVLIARGPALDAEFAALRNALATALERVHGPARAKPERPARS